MNEFKWIKFNCYKQEDYRTRPPIEEDVLLVLETGEKIVGWSETWPEYFPEIAYFRSNYIDHIEPDRITHWAHIPELEENILQTKDKNDE